MFNRFVALLVLPLGLASPVGAEIVPLIPSDPLDGPFVDLRLLPVGLEMPTTAERIRQLSDLDGDPETLTAEESRMLALLSQVLSVAPVAN